MLLNLPPLQAEARLRMDIKATNTVAMTIVTYYICYIPAIAFTIRNHEAKDDKAFYGWVGFIVSFCTFVSSASNPVIYVLRSRRCRSAFWQLVQDPCGTSAFQEKPVKTGKEENQREKNPTLGREPGESRRPEGNSECEALRRPTTATESETPQDDRVAKLRTREDENDDSSDSVDEQVAVHVVKQAWQDGIETEERTDDQDFNSADLVAEGAKRKMNEDERKEIRTFTGKKTRTRIHPANC